jgi:hypothetical protein
MENDNNRSDFKPDGAKKPPSLPYEPRCADRWILHSGWRYAVIEAIVTVIALGAVALIFFLLALWRK